MAAYRYTRRRWLATCAGATAGLAAIAGCSDETDTSSLDDPGATASDGDYGDWPMERYNATNRLSVPHTGLDSEPEVLWTAELEGAGSTKPPVVYSDTVFVNHGLDTCTAIDIHDGEPMWEHETDGSEAIAVSEVGLFVGGDGLEALDRENGDVLWTSGHDRTVTSIRMYDETIYAGLEDTVIAFDNEGGENLEFETPEPVQSLAIDDNQIYARCREDPDVDDFLMVGYERVSGDQLWSHEISHAQQWADDRVTRTFPVIDKIAYTVTNENLISIDGPGGTLDEIVELDQSSWTRPSVHDDIAYLQRGSMAYNLDTSEEPSEWDPDEGADTPMVIAGGTGYMISPGGIRDPIEVVSVDPLTGAVNWSIPAPEKGSSHYPIVLNGLILLPIETLGLVALG
ncbi:outer membrane protein assembly factor BamB family protein [Natrarchaeobaculum sulfurireducens]|uniref:ABC-type branched-chain amino acid transport system, periplasmic component n=1 Tax=Natrarchaeobaculum sulfurireducens TaxID=2044521 RepID=A0A346PFN9_9EURY|nr:PQQ-binding-like beta-propeller repeat protein [Natrarchaeobaculum sulfurireducens]AXR78334.1 ABC-type branched-chain amino acid transport system, periplasmic component [Natrarchaeobaculum sulfurireducens]